MNKCKTICPQSFNVGTKRKDSHAPSLNHLESWHKKNKFTNCHAQRNKHTQIHKIWTMDMPQPACFPLHYALPNQGWQKYQKASNQYRLPEGQGDDKYDSCYLILHSNNYVQVWEKSDDDATSDDMGQVTKHWLPARTQSAVWLPEFHTEPLVKDAIPEVNLTNILQV